MNPVLLFLLGLTGVSAAVAARRILQEKRRRHEEWLRQGGVITGEAAGAPSKTMRPGSPERSRFGCVHPGPHLMLEDPMTMQQREQLLDYYSCELTGQRTLLPQALQACMAAGHTQQQCMSLPEPGGMEDTPENRLISLLVNIRDLEDRQRMAAQLLEMQRRQGGALMGIGNYEFL